MLTVKLVKDEELPSFKDSKEYLERQQNIDFLIALARIAEVAMPGKALDDKITDKIRITLDKL